MADIADHMTGLPAHRSHTSSGSNYSDSQLAHWIRKMNPVSHLRNKAIPHGKGAIEAAAKVIAGV